MGEEEEKEGVILSSFVLSSFTLFTPSFSLPHSFLPPFSSPLPLSFFPPYLSFSAPFCPAVASALTLECSSISFLLYLSFLPLLSSFLFHSLASPRAALPCAVKMTNVRASTSLISQSILRACDASSRLAISPLRSFGGGGGCEMVEGCRQVARCKRRNIPRTQIRLPDDSALPSPPRGNSTWLSTFFALPYLHF